MNKRAKGKRVEKQVSEYIESLGYEVWQPPNVKFQSNDIFYLFDLLAIMNNPGFEDKQIAKMLFIQVKSNISDFYKARKKITEWAKSKVSINNVEYMVIVKLTGKRFRIWKWCCGTTILDTEVET